MIDKNEIKCRFKRSVDSYSENAHVQKLIVDRLFELFRNSTNKMPEKVLEIGCGTGFLSEKLTTVLEPGALYINDLVDEMCLKTAEKCNIETTHCLIGDIENMLLQEKFDLIISTSTFQWFAHPAETFKKLASHLTPGGLMIFSTFGINNFRELRATTGSGLTYHTGNEYRILLLPYFDILFANESLHTIYFYSPLDILFHLKKTGVNASGQAHVWTKGRLEKFVNDYNNFFLVDDKYPLTYHPLYFVCQKK